LLRDRRLLKLILRCAFEAVKQAMKDALPRGTAADATCSAILAIHTAGNLLQWNPHVHGILSEGLFDRQERNHHIPDLDAKLVEDLLTYSRCGEKMRVVSVITDPVVIEKILKHIAKRDRAPPEGHPAAC